MNIAAGILAGGQSRRFNGTVKGLLHDLNGNTIVERQLRVIKESGINDVVLLTNDRAAYDALGIPILSDLRPDNGPLGGIEAALEHFATICNAVLFVPCDLPGLTAREIKSLLEAFQHGDAEAIVAQTADGELQPLCAVLSVGLRKEITHWLDSGRRSVIECLREQNTQAVVFKNARAFYNINTPEDWQRWLANNTND